MESNTINKYDRNRRRDQMAGIKEECGVFGIYDLDGGNVVPSIYYGLTSLQHRGQESCGLAVSDTRGERGKIQGLEESSSSHQGI